MFLLLRFIFLHLYDYIHLPIFHKYSDPIHKLQCKIEWFHFGCVGLKEHPKGKWYCSTCAATRNRRRGKWDWQINRINVKLVECTFIIFLYRVVILFDLLGPWNFAYVVLIAGKVWTINSKEAKTVLCHFSFWFWCFVNGSFLSL
jgi:hypothetical protein